jgi:hypothetical protein
MSFLIPRTAMITCEGQLDLSRLESKISGLENFQTPRTAMEFFAAVGYVLEPVLRALPPSPFRSEFYIAEFTEHPDMQLELAFAGIFKQRRAYASFTRFNSSHEKVKNIMVHTSPAYLIPQLTKDIILEGDKPSKKMPTLVIIDDKKYPIKYGN